jgi:hypothetical protein
LKRKSPPLVLSVQRQLGLGLKKEHGFSLATLFCNLKLKEQKMTNPETLAWLHHSAAVHGSAYSQVLLNLLERVEALEAAENLCQKDEDAELAAPTPEAATVATDDELYQVAYSMPLSTEQGRRRRCYELGRQHGAAQSPAAQPGCIVRGSDAVVTAELEKMVELEKAA